MGVWRSLFLRGVTNDQERQDNSDYQQKVRETKKYVCFADAGQK